jgi:methionyl-tRNA synthetase
LERKNSDEWKTEDAPMTMEMWTMIGAASFLGLVAAGILWWRLPVYQWYCGRCKRIVSASRLHPGKCTCGTDRLMAYVCQSCSSWNTSPVKNWHCNNCASTKVHVGVEYLFMRTLWRWRNQQA